MKKGRILALLLAAVMLLTSFGGAVVFAEPEDAVTDSATDSVTDGVTDAAPDTDADADADGDTAADGEDGDSMLDSTLFNLEDMTELDPTQDTTKYILSAANKAADGREVTAYPLQLTERVGIPVSNDFVGLGVFNASDSSMTLMEPASTSSAYTFYEPEESMVGQTVYWLEVAAITEAEIEWLNDPDTRPEELLVWKQDRRGLFKTAEQRVRAMTKYYEGNDVILYADDQLAEIAVYNTKTKEYFFSTPYDYRRVAGVSSNETKNQIASMLELTYYDNSANAKTIYSYTDAVAKNAFADPDDPDTVDNIQFGTEKIENGVRFNFEIGSKGLDVLLPYAAEKENFELKVIQPLQELKANGNETAELALRKLNSYYTLYHYDDLSTSMKSSLEKNYPGIREHDFYVLRGVHNREKLILSDFIKLTGQYTQADFDMDLELSGYVPDDVVLACFKLHVDITIENGDLIVDMPTDKIEYDTENFTLATVTLMRYFGCGNYTEDGFIFVPDGSGSVINFNNEGTKTSLSMIKQMYGNDYAMNTTNKYYNLNQSAYLPVYGLKAGNRGYFAILEKGDAMATVRSESGNIQSSYETAYATFVYKTVQTITYADGSKQNGDFTYYNENIYKDGYRIRYKLMYGEDIDYVKMAKTYRQYLLDNKLMVGKTDVKNDSVPLVLETLGLIDKTDTFMGIVYNKKIPLTPFDSAQDMIDELMGGGVNNVSLRYRGWMNGGLNYSVPSKLKIESKLGGKSGFKDLVSFMKDKNLSLFPEVDFCVVRRDGIFDGYTTNSNAPKMTDRTTVTMTPRNELDNVGEITKDYFAIAPTSASKYFKAFFGKYDAYDLDSVSIGTVGNMLYSDFRKGANATHRQRAVNLLSDNVSKYVTGKDINRIMVEGGNAYTYSYASEIVDIPLSDSNTFLSDASVPFMQIVLHGHIQYAGGALNLADDMTDTILKSAEYGANLHFTLSAQNTRELKETVYSNYYTIDFDTWKDDVLNLYTKFNGVFAGLQDKEIENHEPYTEVSGVYITTYENGTRIAVNYNRSEVTVEGKKIAAQDFIVL